MSQFSRKKFPRKGAKIKFFKKLYGLNYDSESKNKDRFVLVLHKSITLYGSPNTLRPILRKLVPLGGVLWGGVTPRKINTSLMIFLHKVALG